MNTTVITVLGFLVIFLATTLGSSVVWFFKKDISEKINTVFLGFASGIMIAASVWSLIIPAIEGATESWGSWSFLPAVIGFIAGGLFLVLIDRIVPHFHSGTNEEEGPHAPALSKSMKMFLAVTIHNIPEGACRGICLRSGGYVGRICRIYFSACACNRNGGAKFSRRRCGGIAMKSVTGSRLKSFLYGTASGAVEPVFAVAGFFLASQLALLQPWFLAFAAGAMIFVVAEDLIPDSHLASHPHLGTWGVMIGFAVMMVLDVALG